MSAPAAAADMTSQRAPWMPPVLGSSTYYPSSSGVAPVWTSAAQPSYPWPAMYQFPHNYIPQNSIPAGASPHHSAVQVLAQHNPVTSKPVNSPMPSIPHTATSGSSTNGPVTPLLLNPSTETSSPPARALVGQNNSYTTPFGPIGNNPVPPILPIGTSGSLTNVQSSTVNSGRSSPSSSSDTEEEEDTRTSPQGTMSSTPRVKRTRISTQNPAFGHVQGVMLGTSSTGIPYSIYYSRNSSDHCTSRHATHTANSTSATRLK